MVLLRVLVFILSAGLLPDNTRATSILFECSTGPFIRTVETTVDPNVLRLTIGDGRDPWTYRLCSDYYEVSSATITAYLHIDTGRVTTAPSDRYPVEGKPNSLDDPTAGYRLSIGQWPETKLFDPQGTLVSNFTPQYYDYDYHEYACPSTDCLQWNSDHTYCEKWEELLEVVSESEITKTECDGGWQQIWSRRGARYFASQALNRAYVFYCAFAFKESPHRRVVAIINLEDGSVHTTSMPHVRFECHGSVTAVDHVYDSMRLQVAEVGYSYLFFNETSVHDISIDPPSDKHGYHPGNPDYEIPLTALASGTSAYETSYYYFRNRQKPSGLTIMAGHYGQELVKMADLYVVYRASLLTDDVLKSIYVNYNDMHRVFNAAFNRSDLVVTANKEKEQEL